MFKRRHILSNSPKISYRKMSTEFCHQFIINEGRLRAVSKLCACMMALLTFSACGHGNKQDKVIKTADIDNRLTGYVGSAAGDEPQATMIARDVLVRGGNAADAATALGFALTVTLPSRASLGGGGACIAYSPGKPAESILFMPQPDVQQGQADRPASIPMMARGLYLLQATYGKSDINDILSLVDTLAQKGVIVSDQLAYDIAAVQVPLFSDTGMQTMLSRHGGGALKSGDLFYQPRLKIIYDRLISAGIADLYIGSLAHSYILGAQASGGGLSGRAFRNALPYRVPALTLTYGKNSVYFLSPPADGGLGMASAWQGLVSGQPHALSLAQGSVAQWRANNAVSYDKKTILKQIDKAQAQIRRHSSAIGTLPSLPASTSFTVVDRHGGAVSCALTMNNLFGTGRIAGNTGIVMAASPKSYPMPLFTGAIATRHKQLLTVVSASGQNDASAAGAQVLTLFMNSSTLDDKEKILSHPGAPQGRVNAVHCPEGALSQSGHCQAYTDPKGLGLAINRH
ncbi:hypothetical protein COMNV_01473 [Commensalibacter sp. Nvir]|nr:hypothetical protein COMNV_01473 [Commensalibacter sp. Nvir]